MDQIIIFDIECCVYERIDDRLNIPGVPNNYCISDQSQGTCLVRLIIKLRFPDFPLVGEEKKTSQIMESFSFVKLKAYTTPLIFIAQVIRDID